MAESVLILIALLAMAASLFLILIPAVPVTALEWAIAMVLGVLTGFTRLTPVAAIVVTVFMAIGSTSGFWMPFLGLRGRQLSCLGLVAFFIGMVAGSALIPIPFIGTILGGVIGVILVEFARVREVRQAMQSGGSALRLILYGMIAEFIFAVLVILVTVISIITTG
ncbi:MAG: DUF456 domain-containing protein [Anaerolineae bacterium]|nr:DUF456 domain-containing protein [Anaerolineae bacterium]